jgi:hypothetical protein
MISAIYARKSTEQNGHDDEAKSVTRQVEHATGYAQRKGWTAPFWLRVSLLLEVRRSRRPSDLGIKTVGHRGLSPGSATRRCQ